MAKKTATATTPKRAAATSASIAERFKDFPAIDVLTRRFLDPSDPGSLPILLKDEPANACMNSDHQRQLKPGATSCHLCGRPARIWHIHTCNTSIENRWSQMKSKGYVPVQIGDLQDAGDVSDLFRQKEDTGEMYVRRGDRGQEITMKQPLEAYNFIKRKQADLRNSRSQSVKSRREDLAESVGAGLGDEAGDMIQRGAISFESVTSDKTTLGEEAKDAD